MKFETKYNKDDNVWFMHNNKPTAAKISSVSIFHPWSSQNNMQYTATSVDDPKTWLDFQHLQEGSLFTSKKALLESLH